MSEFITEKEQTTIRKSMHGGWKGTTFVKINGVPFEIVTYKGNSGKIVSYAQRVRKNESANGFTTVSFLLFADKSVRILEETAVATEAKIRELHYKALAIVDQSPEKFVTPEEAQRAQYSIEPGQIIFIDWIQRDIERQVIYRIEGGRAYYVGIQDLLLGSEELSFIRPYSEKFGIGHYYIEGQKMDMNEVANLLLQAEEKKRREEAERPAREAAEKAEWEETRKGLEARYPYLVKPSRDSGGAKNVALNIRIELKRAFPNDKFSVVKESYDCVNIHWTDGPTDKQVKKITDKWEDHVTDVSGDYRDYSPSDFNKVFGGCNYVFEQRTMSDATGQRLEEWVAKEFNEDDPNNYAWRMFSHYAIPTGGWEVRHTEMTCGQVEDLYKIVSLAPAPETPAQTDQIPITSPDGISVTRNTEKNGIEIRFPAKPDQKIIDQLKSHGFRWSGFSKCWWIKFSEYLWIYANQLKS